MAIFLHISNASAAREEPVIAVGLLDRVAEARIRLRGGFCDRAGHAVPDGELRVVCRDNVLRCDGAYVGDVDALELEPSDPQNSQFSLEATIGIDFHWQQRETQSFRGGVLIIAQPADHLTVINRVPLERYLESVVCSEMKATAPPEFIKAHAIISRSWLLAQIAGSGEREQQSSSRSSALPLYRSSALRQGRSQLSMHIRWTDREAHAAFDVCADDHCQRYQGIGRIDAPGVLAAIRGTRGEVLTYAGHPCDARFSKCCGGVIDEFPTAWSDDAVPYLVALRDAAGPDREPPPLADDASMRAFLRDPPPAYCNCSDKALLGRVLNDYDLATESFFRWQTRLTAEEATRLIRNKLGLDLGRLLALEPVERGPSGRLKRLRLVGERGSIVIGKELEIRRALSETHLYSSAFVVDCEGPPQRPDAFVLTGAGWGHGVGLCQIGAAVMAHHGAGYQEILEHYYPGTLVERRY